MRIPNQAKSHTQVTSQVKPSQAKSVKPSQAKPSHGMYDGLLCHRGAWVISPTPRYLHRRNGVWHGCINSARRRGTRRAASCRAYTMRMHCARHGHALCMPWACHAHMKLSFNELLFNRRHMWMCMCVRVRACACASGARCVSDVRCDV